MSLKRLPTPNADAGNWGTILNEYINQLSPTPKGGINTWTTGTRPSSLTVDDEGRTGINTDTNVIERWSGTTWNTILTATSGSQTITLTGDVTGTGTSSFATTLANNSVTYSKLQNISTNNRLLGRATTGTGITEEITIGSGLSLSGSTLSANPGGLGFTPENVSNKSITTTLGTSDTLYPTQNAVKSYVDTLASVTRKDFYTVGLANADFIVSGGNFAAAFNNAKTATASSNFKKIKVLEGTYTAETFITLDNIEVELVRGVTITNGVTGNHIFIVQGTNVTVKGAGTLNVVGTASAFRLRGVDGCKIRGLRFTGTTTASFGVISLHGVEATASNRNVFVEYCKFDQIQSTRIVDLYSRNGHLVENFTLQFCHYYQTHALSLSLNTYDITRNVKVQYNVYENLINIPQANDFTTSYTTAVYGGISTPYTVENLEVIGNIFVGTDPDVHYGFVQVYYYKRITVAFNVVNVPKNFNSLFFAPGRTTLPGYEALVTGNVVEGMVPVDFDCTSGIIYSNNIFKGVRGTGISTGYGSVQNDCIWDSNEFPEFNGTRIFPAAILMGNQSAKNCKISNNIIQSPYNPNLYPNADSPTSQTITISETGQFSFGFVRDMRVYSGGVVSTPNGTITSANGTTGVATGHGSASYNDANKVTITVTTLGDFVFTVSGLVAEAVLVKGTTLDCCNVDYLTIATGGGPGYDFSEVEIYNNTLDLQAKSLTGQLFKQSSNSVGPSFIKDNKIIDINPAGGARRIRYNVSLDLGNKTGAVTLVPNDNPIQLMTLTGNVTFTINAGKIAGQTLELRITQDGTGSRTATWPSNFKKAGGTLTLSTTASALDVVHMRFDGTNWIETLRQLNLS